MSVALPAIPPLADIAPEYVDNAGMLVPPLGGPLQRIARLGDRFGLRVSGFTVDGADARDWIAARLQAKAENQTVTMAWPQDVDLDLPAVAKIEGAGQGGTTLALKGLGAGKALPRGLYFSFFTNGRHYLHMTTSAIAADGTGKDVVSIAPMLRRPPNDNIAVNFLTPTIEGFLEDGTMRWTLFAMSAVGVDFTIAENE